MKKVQPFILLLGRCALSLIFLYAAYNKITQWEATLQYMGQRGLSQESILLFLVCIIEFFGALSLILGFKARWGALMLALFLIPVNLLFHDFWSYTSVKGTEETIRFLGNLAIFGGLLFAFVTGPGSISFDKK